MSDDKGHQIKLVGDGELAYCTRCKGGEVELDEPCIDRMAKRDTDHLATIATLTAENERLSKELAEAKAVVENLVECVKDSPMGMVVTDKKDSWNPDAHIEITLTVADVHAALAALAAKEATNG